MSIIYEALTPNMIPILKQRGQQKHKTKRTIQFDNVNKCTTTLHSSSLVTPNT